MRYSWYIALATLLVSPIATAAPLFSEEPAKPAFTPRLPTDCVPAGCAKQECVERKHQYDFSASCIHHQAYACFTQMGECKRQANNKCGWTPTKELAECINAGNEQEAADALEEEENRFNNTRRSGRNR